MQYSLNIYLPITKPFIANKSAILIGNRVENYEKSLHVFNSQKQNIWEPGEIAKLRHNLMYFILNSNNDFRALQSKMESKHCYKKVLNEVNADTAYVSNKAQLNINIHGNKTLK